MSTSLDSFPAQLLKQPPGTPTKLDLLQAVERMLDEVTPARRGVVIETAAPVAGFNALLEQAKEQFRDADTLRLIEPLGVDASMALVTVRLSLVKRTLHAELARAR